jgi:hypothetical protein
MSRGLAFIGMASALLVALACSGCSALEAERGPFVDPMSAFERPNRPVVQLARARLPQPLTALAVHYWFNAYEPRTLRWERWELWQTAGSNVTSWGHIHRDLMSPMSNVGGGEALVEAQWTGAEAERLISVLHHPELYADRDVYRAWPGPNSNTYVAWILRESGVPFDLSPMAIGKDWRGWVGGGVTTTHAGLHVESPIAGLKIGVLDGVELHVLALTFGFAPLRPSLKTPFGSISLPEP